MLNPINDRIVSIERALGIYRGPESSPVSIDSILTRLDRIETRFRGYSKETGKYRLGISKRHRNF